MVYMVSSSFFQAYGDNDILIYGDGVGVRLRDVRSLAETLADNSPGGIAVLRASRDARHLAAYLACLWAGIPVMILEANTPEPFLHRVIETFRPGHLLGFQGPHHQFTALRNELGLSIQRNQSSIAGCHPDLGVLLSTSGSTGEGKFVRISWKALLHNASAIGECLPIRQADTAITSLPYSYSYGLSIVNSHLLRGGRLIASNEGMTTRDFWNLVREFGVSSFGGVPATYRMLKQLRWNPGDYPSIRYSTQAGGHLGVDDRQYFLDLLESAGAEFFVMYGQTEATARMTIAPPNLLRSNITSVGFPLRDGSLTIKDPDSNGIGEVVYAGPNVMMGYATTDQDLALGDSLKGKLSTGDLGLITRGALTLMGRTKRIAKVYGKRVFLDDAESWAGKYGDCVAVSREDLLILATTGFSNTRSVVEGLANYLGVSPLGIRVIKLPTLPQLSSGKPDYAGILEFIDLQIER